MKPALLLLGVLLGAAWSAHVAAQPEPGFYVSWEDCQASQTDASPACDTEAGQTRLNVWFIAAEDMQRINSAYVVLSVKTVTDSLPDWWQFQPGGCRASVPSLDVGDGNSCQSLWRGETVVELSYQRQSPRTIDIEALLFAPESDTVSVPAGAERLLFTLAIPNVGTDRCAGCWQGACAGAFRVDLGGPGGSYYSLQPGFHHWAGWQGGTVGVTGTEGVADRWGTLQCHSLATPTRQATWGEVKVLYR